MQRHLQALEPFLFVSGKWLVLEGKKINMVNGCVYQINSE